jgi:hypothetical protein
MPWQPGQSGNPKGRVVGTLNRRTEAIWGKLEARGDTDPAEFLSSVVHDEQAAKEHRIIATMASDFPNEPNPLLRLDPSDPCRGSAGKRSQGA